MCGAYGPVTIGYVRLQLDAHYVPNWTSAAGAVEAVICLMALRGQWLPPTSTLGTPDPACAFPVVREPAHARLEFALSNSFGFGGANATLVLRRWSG